MVTANCQFSAIRTERQRPDRNGAWICLRRVGMRRSGKIAQPRCFRVRAIELGAFPYPTPNQGHGRLRGWVIFLWHAVIGVLGADSFKEVSARPLAGNYP